VLELYLSIKFIFLYSLVRVFVKHEPLQRHLLFIAALYTGGVFFLYWSFYLSSAPVVDWHGVKIWVSMTFGLALVYFWLLRRVDLGFLFVLLLGAGLFLVLF
jgi:hypothetical protein